MDVSKSKRAKVYKSFLALYKDQLPPELIEIVGLHLTDRKAKGARYTSDFKELAINIYNRSPKCYKYLQPILKLPSRSTLQRVTSKWDCSSGLNENLLKAIADKLCSSSELAKYCILCIDEISLKPLLSYSEKADKLIGTSDFSDSTLRSKISTHATVLMARGLFVNWKQPLCFWTVRDSFKTTELLQESQVCLPKLRECGFNIKGFVSDMGRNFWSHANRLGVTPERPYFVVNDIRIPYIFDVPHLMKATRNCLSTYGIEFNGEERTSWEHIVKVYEKDLTRNQRIAPKLTYAHVNPTNKEKMRVKYATQVISSTIAGALETYAEFNILPSSAMATSEFVAKFDCLFDLLNSCERSREDKPYTNAFKGEGYQLDYLNEMSLLISSIEVFDSNERDVTNKFSFLRGWRITIGAVREIWNGVKDIDGVKSMYTRRLNQDPLENFFGEIRNSCGKNTTPTIPQFVAAYKNQLYKPLLKNRDGKGNCEVDDDRVLVRFLMVPDQNDQMNGENGNIDLECGLTGLY